GRDIEEAHTSVIAGGERIALPAQPVVQRQIGTHLPLIACVERPLVEADRVRILVLDRLSRSRRQPEQELRETVELADRCPSAQCGWAPIELEAAACRLEGSTLRLEVVDTAAVELKPKP